MKNQLHVDTAAALVAQDSLADGYPLKAARSAENFSWEKALDASRIALMGQETWDSLAA